MNTITELAPEWCRVLPFESKEGRTVFTSKNGKVYRENTQLFTPATENRLMQFYNQCIFNGDCVTKGKYHATDGTYLAFIIPDANIMCFRKRSNNEGILFHLTQKA